MSLTILMSLTKMSLTILMSLMSLMSLTKMSLTILMSLTKMSLTILMSLTKMSLTILMNLTLQSFQVHICQIVTSSIIETDHITCMRSSENCKATRVEIVEAYLEITNDPGFDQ